jgi:serine/threonine protein kinase
VTIRTKLINRRYRLERRTTLSSTTETWLGFDNVLHRAVAVTLPRQEMLRDAPFLVEFLQRSRIATAMHHRGIVAAFDSGEDGDLPYLVTEYSGGEQLAGIIQVEAPFDVDDVAILVEQVAGALDYAHQRGFAHGAMTSADIIVDGQGATRLLGLGLPIGAVPWRDEFGHRSPLTFDDDVQALAAIAFEMLTGEDPNTVEPDAAGVAYLIDPDVPRNASDIVSIGLGAGPARFSSAGAFARSLSDWRGFDPGEYYVAPEPEQAPYEELSRFEQEPRSAIPVPEFDDWPVVDELPENDVVSKAPGTPRGVKIALLAALVLALLAGIVVWRGSDAAPGPSTAIPAQIETLAGLSGF